MNGPGRPRPPRWTWERLSDQLLTSCELDTLTGCLIWQHGTDKNGYPKLMIDGRSWRGNRAVLYADTGRLGPMGLHSCHRPPCLNRRHLRWGTAAENAQDMWNAGRASRNLRSLPGERNGRAKVTDIQRAEIVARRTAGEPRALVAARYSLSESAVARITNLANARIPTGRPKAGNRT